jgi:hypothetical protein
MSAPKSLRVTSRSPHYPELYAAWSVTAERVIVTTVLTTVTTALTSVTTAPKRVRRPAT